MSNILRSTEQTGTIAGTHSTNTIGVEDASVGYGVLLSVTVDSPSVTTVDSATKASLVVQDLTYTAVSTGTTGNSITIDYDTGGTAGSEVVTVTSNAIVVSMDATDVTGSTATQIKAAIEASVTASALVTVAVSGTGSNVQSATSATALAGGLNSELDLSNDLLTIPSHGYATGLKVALTTAGTLPTGLSAINYYIINVSPNTIKLAISMANAIAGTAVNIIGEGSGTHTLTPAALSGATYTLQCSNDGVEWVDAESAVNITATAKFKDGSDAVPLYKFTKVLFSLTAGQLSYKLYTLVK